MTKPTLTAADLAGFTGSEVVYRHSLVRNVVYTEGVKFLAEKAGAYWLIDKVATLQMEPTIRAEDFQHWMLNVAGSTAILTCDDGNENMIHVEKIDYTDFPMEQVRLYAVMGELRTIMLPSEY